MTPPLLPVLTPPVAGSTPVRPMLLLPARCLSGAQERVIEAMAILAFVGLSRTVRDAPRRPVVERIPTPEYQTCEHIIDRLDALSAFLVWACDPNRELIAV